MSARKPANGNANGILKANGNHKIQDPKTDPMRWRLRDVRGRQTWHYLSSDEELKTWPMTAADRYFLGLDTSAPALPKASTPLRAADNGLQFFKRLQLEPGNWACEYGGPMFLIPGFITVSYVTDLQMTQPEKTEMIRYLFNMQNLGEKNGGDGGWGLHIEADSSVFGTAMNYTALRLLGVPADDPRMRKARGCLYDLGGAVNGPHWAKFFLAVLGVVKWDIVNPVPPELWLLPDWVPFAPWRWWIHMRQVYLPMGYIWSKKWVYPRADVDPLVLELREELFHQKYEDIDWALFRNAISPSDDFYPKTWVLNLANLILIWLWIPFLRFSWIVKRAEEWSWKLIQIEDANTDFSNLGPVNGPMNLLCCYIKEGPDAYSVKRHRDRCQDFLWLSQDGYMMNGTNGVQTWDTAFAIQAAIASGLAQDPKHHDMLTKALGFLEDQQFIEDSMGFMVSSAYSDPPTAKTTPETGYRQARKGAWGFSNRDQGYTVSDCTAEAMKSVVLLQTLRNSKSEKLFAERLDLERVRWAADIILTMQNETGGVASYEPRRGSKLIELLNAAEVFGNIMVEYDYPECTTACVTALHLFSQAYPHYRRNDIDEFITRAVDWIRKDQRPDGSWYGSWGICFTYATMFALESLATQGESYTSSERVKRACGFLIKHQNEDGGWGESYKSCETGEWCQHPDGSQVVQTAWAVLGLLEAEYPNKERIERGVKLIMDRQQKNGEWLQEAIEGVFNKSCMISYPNYKFVFPIKALGMFAQRYGNPQLR